MQHTWTGGDLMFSYCTDGDLPEIARMLSKESVCRWLFFGPNTEEATRSYFLPLVEGMQAALREGRTPDHHVFTLRLHRTEEFVGQCALFPVDFSPGSYLVGYQIDDTHWGKGYGTLACRFLVYVAFAVLDGYRLNGDAVAGNTASLRVMEKCGFVREGLQRGYWHARGGRHDRVLLGLLRDDLPAGCIEALAGAFSAR